MIVKHVKTSILVGRMSRRALRKMVTTAKRHYYNAVWPWEFCCQGCKLRWGGRYIEVGVDLDKVSCSNCYSDNVRLTQIKIEVLEDSDFSEGGPA